MKGEMLFSVRTLVFALLAVGPVQAFARVSPPRPQAAAHAESRSAGAKSEKQFSYLSAGLGVRFRYPAEYTLVPSPSPKALSEAVCHWIPSAAPHGPAAAGPSHKYYYNIQMIRFGFTTTAGALGYSLKSGKWTHPRIRGGYFESIKSIQGNGWKGLVATFQGRLHSTTGKFLGMAEGQEVIAGNNETASVDLNFFPDEGTQELRQAILRSIRFVSPKSQVTKARKLFRSERLGVEFKYPASYRLVAMHPFSPPGVASDSLPVEAAYELKPLIPPCCAGVGGYAYSYQYYIVFLKLDFLSAAKGLGFTRNQQGGWMYKDVGSLNKAERTSGKGWNGLRMTYYFRLYRAPTVGNPYGGGYLGASDGEKNLVSAGGKLSVVLEFDPQEKEVCDAILKSLRFFKPRVQAEPARTRP